ARVAQGTGDDLGAAVVPVQSGLRDDDPERLGHVAQYTRRPSMPRRRVRLRPPGLKPWTRIGTLGPFRGRLGLSWVGAAVVGGRVVLAAGPYALLRPHPPGGSFVPVGAASSFPEGTARAVNVPGAFVGRTGGQLVAVLQEDGCSLAVQGNRYRD